MAERSGPEAAKEAEGQVTDCAVNVPDDQSIWHYRQYAEFVAILQCEALWFSRLNHLQDPFEGVSGRQSRFHMKADDHTRKGCVSCWTVDDEESELMWYSYAPGHGVAIRSTKTRLKASLRPPEAVKIIIGSVEYGTDWSKGPPRFLTIPNGYAFLKRRGFKGEQELRAYVPYEYEYDSRGVGVEPTLQGRPVGVDLRSLIAEIWVAPYAPDWFRAVVEAELKRYGYQEIPVRMRT
jgi:hypothetical protein